MAHADRYPRNITPQGLSHRALATGCMNHSSVTSLDRTPEVVCQFHLDVISSMKSGVDITQVIWTVTLNFYLVFRVIPLPFLTVWRALLAAGHREFIVTAFLFVWRAPLAAGHTEFSMLSDHLWQTTCFGALV